MVSKNVLEHFAELPDPREDNRRHLLLDIIVIVICASVCGAEKWDDIEAFGHAKQSWLRTFLQLPHGIPSHDTFARVFAKLDPAALNERFYSWVAAVNPNQEQEIVSIDGKTVRHSYDRTNGINPIHMVSAWASKAGLTLGQTRVDEKSNEITAIPQLLQMLELNGCIVTIDAMGTQTGIAAVIVDRQADYLLALKGNQGTLHDDVQTYFQNLSDEDRPHLDHYRSVDTDHGRVEVREYWCTEQIAWLDPLGKWKGLKSIGMEQTRRIIGEEESNSTRYFISSLGCDAQQQAKTVRAHWGIENSLHWVLDVAFREDECRKRKDNSAENFAILRHITLNLLKQEKTCKRSIAGKRLLAGWDTRYMEKVLFGV